MARKNPRFFSAGDAMALDLGEMEIWDGADLALLRDTLTRLIRVDKHRAVAVNMSHVKYIPSGFFGMMFDWHEEGVRMRLLSPQPNVQKMLWFVRFFQPVSDNCFELTPERYQAPEAPAFPASTVVTEDWSLINHEISVASAHR